MRLIAGKWHEDTCSLADGCVGLACYVAREPSDPINPGHYKTTSGLEAIDVIESFKLGYRLGNAIKYILRAGKKGPADTDIRKAIWYLERELNKGGGGDGVDRDRTK